MNPQNSHQNAQYIDEYDTQYEYAGFWVRFITAVIDTVIIAIILTPITWLLAINGLSSGDRLDFTTVVAQIITAAIYVFCWVKYATTPAKHLFKLKILDVDTGKHLTLTKAIIRYVGYVISVLLMFVGVIWIAFDPRKQGWHDKMANSVVVKEIH